MHTIYYIHVIKDIYKSRQFHPPTMLYTYIDFNLSKDFSVPSRDFSGGRIKIKLNFTRTHVNFILFHKIIRSHSRLIRTGFYESDCCPNTTE